MTHRSLLAAFLYAAVAACATPASAGGLQDEISALREGDMRKLVVHEAPRKRVDIAFATLEGAPVSLADSDGKVRIVNFWATWCAPCRQEKPALDALNAEYSGADFEVVAIATGRNSPEGIKRFNEENGVETLASYTDNGSAAARAMGVLGLPVSILLDREGREIGRLTGGADWTSESSKAIVERLIAAGG